jgi:predicted MFS family arabinose efflux permease
MAALFNQDNDKKHVPSESEGTTSGLDEPEDGIAPIKPGKSGVFASFQYRDFRYLWLGQISQALALWMEQIARPLLILSPLINGSAVHLGLVFAARTVPQLGMGIFAGVIADWYDRRTILLVAKTGSATMNFILAALVLTGQIELWHIYAHAFIKGGFNSLDQPARQSMIPSIVPREQVTNAVALNSATMNTMRIVGAAIAGLLVKYIGFGETFLLTAIIFMGAVFFTYKLSLPPQAKVENKSVKTALVSFKEGVQYGWSTPSIRWVITLAMVYFIFGMSYMQVFAPLFAKDILEIGEDGFGLMLSLTGLGGVIGAMTLAALNLRRHRGYALMFVMSGFGVMLIIFSMSTYFSIVPLSLAVIIMVGMFQTPFNTLANSVLLDSAPAEMRGRVMALISLDRSVITIGATAAGFTAVGLGVQQAQIIFGAIVLAGVFIIAITVPAVRRIQ